MENETIKELNKQNLKVLIDTITTIDDQLKNKEKLLDALYLVLNNGNKIHKENQKQ